MKMLRTARKAAGLTMKELGEKVGVSESAISQYETGKREADFETLLKIGEILDCSIDYLLRGEQKKRPTPEDGDGPALDEKLINCLIQLTAEEQEKVETFVQGLIAAREIK